MFVEGLLGIFNNPRQKERMLLVESKSLEAAQSGSKDLTDFAAYVEQFAKVWLI